MVDTKDHSWIEGNYQHKNYIPTTHESRDIYKLTLDIIQI